jgi:RNA polymerase sigma-70 factor, ECF subfamily
MQAGPSDAEHVAAARRGDRGAFGHLWRRHAAMVHGVLMARVAPMDVDDLMQDVFVAALEKLGTLRDDHAFAPWLAAMARNRAVDFHRGRRRMDEIPETLGKVDAERAEAERVLFAIRALPEAYREPLVLRLVEGMTGPEIAARVGLEPGSVRVNLHRGMNLLRDKLGLGAAADAGAPALLEADDG